MSSHPRALRSVKTFSQNLAPSVCSSQMPRMSRVPSGKIAKARYSALLRTTASSRILTRSASKNTTGYSGSERARLPRGHLRHDRVGDRADQIGRDLDRVHLEEERLDLAHGHPAGVERDDLVVEPREASLVFADELRLKCALAIARDGQRQRPLLGEHGLPAAPVAIIGRLLGFGRAA